MAKEPVNAPTGRGKGRGAGRGRGRGGRNILREAYPSPDIHSTMRRGRGTGATKRGVPRDAAACPTGNPSVGEKTPQNMFGGEDDGAGGVGYMERGLTVFDHNYLSGLSAPEIALLYGRHAGKAMALGCWAARRMLVELGVSRAIARENKHLRSELNHLKARLLPGSVESGLATSKGKEVLIDLSEDEDADQLDADSPCHKNRWGKLPDSPPSPPPAEPLCRSPVNVHLAVVVLDIVNHFLSSNNS